MSTKSLGAIIAIAIVSLILFSIAGSMLGEASPKVRIKIAIEKTLPVKIESIETVQDAETKRRVLAIVAAPKSETVTAHVASAIAARAAAVLKSGDTIPMDYDMLEVRLPGVAPARFERMEIERRAHFDSR